MLIYVAPIDTSIGAVSRAIYGDASYASQIMQLNAIPESVGDSEGRSARILRSDESADGGVMYSIIFAPNAIRRWWTYVRETTAETTAGFGVAIAGTEASIKGFTLGRCIEHAPTEPLNEAREDSWRRVNA